MRSPRLSGSALKVLRFLLLADRQYVYAAMICRETLVGPGTLSPLLARLETFGWIESRWQEADPRASRHRRLRCYRLSGVGEAQAGALLDELKLPQAPNE